MIIDFHAHTFPSKIAAKTIGALSQKSGTVPFTDGTDEGLISSMSMAGIDCAVVLSVATNPEKVSRINDISAGKNGKGSLIFFGAMHPCCHDWEAELYRIKELGFSGIKLHPIYQGVDFNDERYINILKLCRELNLIVTVHAGEDIGFPGEYRCTPKMIEDAVNRAVGVKLVLAHMGGWRNWDEVRSRLAPLPVFFDTSFSVGTLTPREGSHLSEQELALMSNEEFEGMINHLGAERILFATDSPWDSQKKAKDLILSLNLSDEDKSAILGGNAKKLLNLK